MHLRWVTPCNSRSIFTLGSFPDVACMAIWIDSILDLVVWYPDSDLADYAHNYPGSRSNVTKQASSDCSLLVGGNKIKPSTTVCDLGVLLDSELSLKQHVNKVVGSPTVQLVAVNARRTGLRSASTS